jgi:hypothetical protein
MIREGDRVRVHPCEASPPSQKYAGQTRYVQNTEYLQFDLSLLMFLVIIFGSYWFIVRGPGNRM